MTKALQKQLFGVPSLETAQRIDDVDMVEAMQAANAPDRGSTRAASDQEVASPLENCQNRCWVSLGAITLDVADLGQESRAQF